MTKLILEDIKKSEIKIVNGDKWRFDFRENGWVVLRKMRKDFLKKKEVVSWDMQLHGVDVESCLQYIFSYYNGNINPLKYEELQDV